MLEPKWEMLLSWGWTVFKRQNWLLSNSFSCHFLFLLGYVCRLGRKSDLTLGQILNVCSFEELSDLSLFELVVLIFYSLEQPIRVHNLGHWVQASLQGRRNSYDLHYRSSEALLVVVPVNNRSQIEVLHSAVAGPLFKKLFHHKLFSFEDHSGNCTVCYRCIVRFLGDNELNVETFFHYDL